MIKNKFSLIDLVFQIIPVMIGVFLAFLVSNWAAKSRSKSKIITFEKNINAEIHSNRENVKSVLDYHFMLRDSSTYYYQNKISNNKTQFFEGIRTQTLNNSVFETGIQTGLLNELTFEQIQLINKVYTLQENYNDYATLMLSGLITMDFDENENEQNKIFRFLSVSMIDILIKENELIAEYDKLLTELNFNR